MLGHVGKHRRCHRLHPAARGRVPEADLTLRGCAVFVDELAFRVGAKIPFRLPEHADIYLESKPALAGQLEANKVRWIDGLTPLCLDVGTETLDT